MTHLLYIYWLFLKIGFFTFGGGYAMIPLFQTELVDRHQYLTCAEFANIVAIAQMNANRIGIDHKGTGRVTTAQTDQTKFLLYKTQDNT